MLHWYFFKKVLYLFKHDLRYDSIEETIFIFNVLILSNHFDQKKSTTINTMIKSSDINLR